MPNSTKEENELDSAQRLPHNARILQVKIDLSLPVYYNPNEFVPLKSYKNG